MSRTALATDSELERARHDLAFRHQLVTKNLDMLLAALSRMRQASAAGKAETAQMQEGAQLAVQLSDILHRLAEDRTPKAG